LKKGLLSCLGTINKPNPAKRLASDRAMRLNCLAAWRDDHQGNAMASQPRGPAGETYRSMVTDTCYVPKVSDPLKTFDNLYVSLCYNNNLSNV